MKKKFLATLLISSLALLLVACGGKGTSNEKSKTKEPEKKNISTHLKYPLYSLPRIILKENM